MRAESSANPSWLGHEIEVDSNPKKREKGHPSTLKKEGNKVVLFFY